MMEEASLTPDDYDYDSFDEQTRPAERWAPLGATASPQPEVHRVDPMEELKRLEDEQDQLNSSLLALTTHFAQVQFRLKQIVSAPPEDKEELLKELEQFAFKGIPDVRGCHIEDAQMLEELSEKEHESKINEQRQKQQELIEQLKSQLEDLEKYAYETGSDNVPTSLVMEKQKVIIDELRQKLALQSLEDYAKLSPEQLRTLVDSAIGEIVNPAKVKEKLVEQLKTQIVDLERFIDFLQGEATSPGPLGATRCACGCPKHNKEGDTFDFDHKCSVSSGGNMNERLDSKADRNTALSIMKKALTILQVYAISQLGCGSQSFQKNQLKKTKEGNHWGDLRAKLEVSVNDVCEEALRQQNETSGLDGHLTDEEDYIMTHHPALTTTVRKHLAMALRDLVQHGLMEVGQSRSLALLGCLPSRSGQQRTQPIGEMHAWDIIVKYYEMKHGREYNESPARKLSSSFSLNMVGGKAVTAKQTLLSAIGQVIESHTPYKRSADSHFKAFVCLALNQKKLSAWFKIIFRIQVLIDYYYQPWSYIATAGFEECCHSLDRLKEFNFQLPVDLAVRPFQNIKDAF